MLLKEQQIITNFVSKGKFVDEKYTHGGDERAYVDLIDLKTLWFNTGTRCDLECTNCYIESSPSNDALSFINIEDVSSFLDEIKTLRLNTRCISFTGGEPFLNKQMLAIIELCLSEGFEVLVLSNAYKLIKRYGEQLQAFEQSYPNKLNIRVSLDHYTQNIHEQERGKNTFNSTLSNITGLLDLGLNVSIAGRSLLQETTEQALAGYNNLFVEKQIPLALELGKNIVVFPEMSTSRDVPEISTKCWDILNVLPEQQMCASERMVVKRKGDSKPVVLPCTLIAYNEAFELGHTLKESFKPVYLNHPYCAQFCVLGGASCSA